MNGKVIFRWILFLVAVFLLTLGGSWLRQQLSPNESGPLAEVTWETGGEPNQVQVLLVDEQNKPLITTLITLYTNTGYHDCVTDLRGVAIAECGGKYLVGIHSQHHSVFSKSLAGFTGWPALDEGLKFKIVAKRPDLIAAPQDYLYATPEEISAAQSDDPDEPLDDDDRD